MCLTVEHFLLVCRDTQQCASTKLLCFTRSSPLIHHLPTHYPSTVVSQETIDLLSEVVFSKLDKLALCKLSSIQTQSSVQELLRSFIRSPSQQVLLLLANMQEVGRDIINHLRVMMEEVEVQAQPVRVYQKSVCACGVYVSVELRD